MRLWQIIEGSREIVVVQRIGNISIASPKFAEWWASEWRITAGNESAVVIIDYVQLVIAGESKCSDILSWVTLNNASDDWV